jgi:hypothetical protein
MAKVGHKIRLVVLGTKKSQILDRDEEFVLEFAEDEELRQDFSDANELLNHFVEHALNSGDMIKSLLIDGEDYVRSAVMEKLTEYAMNAEDAYPEVSSMPFFYNADPSDVHDIVVEVASSMNSSDEGKEVDEY